MLWASGAQLDWKQGFTWHGAQAAEKAVCGLRERKEEVLSVRSGA